MFLRSLASLLAMAVLSAAFVAPLTAVAEETKTNDVKVREITLKVPEDWKSKPGSAFRVAQFTLPAAEGDDEGAELVVFHFGRAGGGGVADNITRWTNQFEAEGRTLKVFEGKSDQGKYTLVQLTGTWNKPVGPPIAMKTTKAPGTGFLAVILNSAEDGDYFIRLTGPAKSVESHATAFRTAFGGTAESEKEVENKK